MAAVVTTAAGGTAKEVLPAEEDTLAAASADADVREEVAEVAATKIDLLLPPSTDGPPRKGGPSVAARISSHRYRQGCDPVMAVKRC